MIRRMKEIFSRTVERLNSFRERRLSDRIERNRFLVIFLGIVFFLDFLFFCFHTGRNPLNIFPAFTVLDDSREINVYLPGLDGKTFIKETRHAPVMNDVKGFVRFLTYKVVRGSNFENTSRTVPVELNIRGVSILGDLCIIDFWLTVLGETAEVIPGSEKTFRNALQKTITENIPTIKKVIVLENGIPNKNIWEVAASE